jgi:hypothetical protein
MTIRITTHQVCDRCGKPYDEKHLKYGEDVPTFERKPLKLTHGDHVVLCYEDLCENCDGVVQGLINKMKHESEPRKARVETTEASPSPKTETASVSKI